MRFKLLVSIAIATVSIASYSIPMRSCKDYAAKIPNVKPQLCESAKLQDTQARSVLGRPIWGSEVRAEDARLRVLVLGAIQPVGL